MNQFAPPRNIASMIARLLACLLALSVLAGTARAADLPAAPRAEVIDPKKLLSPADVDAILAEASTYIEGEEMIYHVEALGKDIVRIKLGIIPKPDGRAVHGMFFMLRRTPKGWKQDQRDPGSIWRLPS